MPLTRRAVLAGGAALSAGVLGLREQPLQAAEPLIKGTFHADERAWRVGFSTHVFRALTLFETRDKIARGGPRHAELFAWRRLGLERLNIGILDDVSALWTTSRTSRSSR